MYGHIQHSIQTIRRSMGYESLPYGGDKNGGW